MNNSENNKKDKYPPSGNEGTGNSAKTTPPSREREGFAFLFKPVFFIFSLIAGSWIVLKIEKLSPSDFGKYKSLFEPAPISKEDKQHRSKQNIQIKIPIGESQKIKFKKLVFDYKNGLLDSALLDKKLEEFFINLR